LEVGAAGQEVDRTGAVYGGATYGDALAPERIPSLAADYLLRTPWTQPIESGAQSLGALLQDHFVDAQNLWRTQRFLLAEVPDRPLLDKVETLFSARSVFGVMLSRATTFGWLSEVLKLEFVRGIELIKDISTLVHDRGTNGT